MGKIIEKNILICPNCNNHKLEFTNEYIICNKCNKKYDIKNNKFYFVKSDTKDIKNYLDKIKLIFKKFKNLYELLRKLISPVYAKRGKLRKFIKLHITNKDIVAVNIGSGNTDLSDDISNIDLFPYENVDLTCDIQNIPLKDDSIDAVINIGVLEHVKDPFKVVKEIHRILKRNGLICCAVPFIQGFHASPNDFMRFTYEGMKILFKDFEIVELIPIGGPTSSLLWIFQEWLALFLSFGIKRIYKVLYFIIMILTFPVKFIDVILLNHPMAKNIASSFLIIARKK